MFPLRSSKPVFDEKNPLSLRRYFEDVEELCERYCNPSDSIEKIYRALYYAPDPSTEDLWRSYNTPGTTWGQFKHNIMRLYPGSQGRFHVSDLRRFVERSAQGAFTSEEDVGEYHREFSKIANQLLEDRVTVPGIIDLVYRDGIPRPFYHRVLDQLVTMCIAEGRGRGPLEYGREEVYEVALEVFQKKGR
jgi:hypothetical protein